MGLSFRPTDEMGFTKIIGLLVVSAAANVSIVLVENCVLYNKPQIIKITEIEANAAINLV